MTAFYPVASYLQRVCICVMKSYCLYLYQRENKRLQETNMRLEQENDDLAHCVATRRPHQSVGAESLGYAVVTRVCVRRTLETRECRQLRVRLYWPKVETIN